MDRDQLVDLTRRAVKLARDKTTDLAPAEYRVRADTYTSPDRHARDIEMVLASPQLVGYVSELPKPVSYCTKTVMGRSILLTRTTEGLIKAFENVCLHRQSQITEGCGSTRRLVCPYHAWNYDLDGNLVGVTPMFKRKIPAGRHVVKLVHPQTNELVVEQVIVVTDGQSITVQP